MTFNNWQNISCTFRLSKYAFSQIYSDCRDFQHNFFTLTTRYLCKYCTAKVQITLF